MKWLKKILFLSITGFFLIGISIFLCNTFVVNSTKDKVFSKLEEIPKNEVALVLGTNPLIANTYKNKYFEYRMDAAEDLYKSQKVKHFILSGDNGQQSYDEPTAMRDALLQRGIPESAITLDYAGFRTLDSVVRCKEVFQQEKITIISQEFHNYRALLMAQKYGIKAVAFNAAKPYPSVRTKPEYREYLARCKAVLDLYILNKQPKFLGKKIQIKT